MTTKVNADTSGGLKLTSDTSGTLELQSAGNTKLTVNSSGASVTTMTASGIIKTDDTTAATSTTDGSLQTDGGLSVAGDAVVGGNMSIAPDKDTSNTSGKFLCVEGTSQTNPSVIIQKGAAANYGFSQTEVFNIAVTSAAEISRITGTGSNGFRAYIKVIVVGHTGSVANGHCIEEVYYDGGTTAVTELVATIGGGGNNPDITFDVSSSNVLIIKVASGDGSNTFKGVCKIEYMFPIDFSNSTWVVS